MSNYKTYQIKLYLTPCREVYLNRIFKEAKWFYNDFLSNYDFKRKTNYSVVNVLNPISNVFEERDLLYLSSQMKQELKKRIKSSIKGLSKRKANKAKIGRLKFKSELNSIPLKNQTFDVVDGKIKIQGFKKLFRCFGLKQFEECNKIASAVLVRKSSGFYIYITGEFSVNKNKLKEKYLGIDLGIKETLVQSNGQTLEKIKISEPIRLKRLQKTLSRKKKGSNNRNRLKQLISLEYEKMFNRKVELLNQIMNVYKKEGINLVFQDDSVSGWHSGLFSRSVQHSIIGKLKAKMKQSESLVVDRFERTTRKCSSCETNLEFGLETRWIKCNSCGYEDNRDVNAAKNILKLGLKQIGLDESNLKLVETELDFSKVNTLIKLWSMKQEILTLK